MGCVTQACFVGFPGLDEFVERVLANRLQQPVAGPTSALEGHHRCLDQMSEQIEHLELRKSLSGTHHFGCLEREPPVEDGQPSQ